MSINNSWSWTICFQAEISLIQYFFYFAKILKNKTKWYKIIYMNCNKYNNNFTEYEKAINFLKNGCNCVCSNKIPKEKFAKMWEAIQALSKSE